MLKKFLASSLACLMVLSSVGCSLPTNPDQVPTPPSTEQGSGSSSTEQGGGSSSGSGSTEQGGGSTGGSGSTEQGGGSTGGSGSTEQGGGSTGGSGSTEQEGGSTGEGEGGGTTEPSTPAPTPTYKDARNILIIGDALAADAFMSLPNVFAAQGEKNEYTFGVLTKSGLGITNHADNATNNTAAYGYLKCTPSDNGTYSTAGGKTIEYALEDHQWDMVFFQNGVDDLRSRNIRATKTAITSLKTYVQSKCSTVQYFGWNTAWAKSTSTISDYANTFTATTNHIINDSSLGFSKVISSGAAIIYANQEQAVASDTLFRDTGILSDFGRVIAAYSFYAQFTGNAITSVNLSGIAKANRVDADKTADLVLTNAQKNIIKASANYALATPWTPPAGTNPPSTDEGSTEEGGTTGGGSTEEGGTGSEGEGTTPSTPNAPTPDLSSMKKILIIGNSHSEDIFAALPAVFNAEGYEGYTFGTARRGSCTITMHKENIIKGTVLYNYQKCTPSDNGIYSAKAGTTMKNVLKDEAWDIVYIQAGGTEVTEVDMCKSDRDYVVNYIKDTCTNPDVKIAYSNSWIAPYADSETNRTKIYNKYKKDTELWGALIDKIEFRKPIKQHNATIRLFENNILNDTTYLSAIHTGTAVLYANQTLGLPAETGIDSTKPNLYRDAMHMSDYGRVLVAYSFFAQYTGTAVTNINLQVLPASSRGAYDPEKNPNIPDLTLATEWSSWNNWKNYMIESVEYSRTNPWTIWANEEA